MAYQRIARSLATAAAAIALTSTTVANAAAPSQGVSPLVTLSAMGTAESRAAVCGANCAALAAATVAQYDDDRDGRDLWLVLLVIAGMIAAYFLLEDAVLGDDGDFDIDIPFSPG